MTDHRSKMFSILRGVAVVAALALVAAGLWLTFGSTYCPPLT
ncbi:hypothetical protein [Zongyangia hominis]|nr:hypothetical protein [Zongyangia hominis]